jgi:hypothetical protein
MYITARVVSSASDSGSREGRLVESDIRRAILSRLQQVTEEGRRESPPFMDIVDLIRNDLDTILGAGPLSSEIKMSAAHKNRVAAACLENLSKQYGNLDPRVRMENGSRNTSTVFSFFGRRSGLNRSRDSTVMPNPTLGPNIRQSSDRLRREEFKRGSNQYTLQGVSLAQAGSSGSSTHVAVTRPQSIMTSPPSRWASSVSAYTATVGEGH